MSASIYVYYRVDPAHIESARNAVENILAEMRVRLCPRARLMAKADEPLLWMEAYDEVSQRADFEHALDAAVRRHGLDICLAPGERRHVETFVPQCASS